MWTTYLGGMLILIGGAWVLDKALIYLIDQSIL